jgi:arginine-glutamic acid dipeptide repeat-containing protein
MYLQAARSIAAFAGMCDRGLPEDMYEVAQRDDTTINALTVLHNHDYDCKRAIQSLVKCPIPKGIDRKWSDDDQKKFIKGLRQYGKNFYRIRKEHLSHKETSDLVEFYYLWKKTPQAQSSRPRRRQRPCSTSVNLSTTPTPAKQRNTKNNNKDESEHNSDNDDNNQTTTDIDEQFCRHCQTTSKDLQAGGRDSQQLCYDCRMYYKKYGEMPIINQEPPPYLFKPLNETRSPSSSTSKRKRNKLKQSSSSSSSPPPLPPPPPPPSSSSSSSSASTSTVEKSDENNSSIKTSSTRSKKKTRINEQTLSIKQEGEDEENLKDESKLNIGIKIEEQENEKPLIGKIYKISFSINRFNEIFISDKIFSAKKIFHINRISY